MLGKLLKHDFKSTGKILLPLNLLLIVITIIGCILLKLDIFENVTMIPLAITLLLVYILSILAVSLISIIYLVVHYYRNMFSAQGYLTFTLPASRWSIFHSKLIVGFCWGLINTLLTYVSIFALLSSAVGFKKLLSGISQFFTTEFPADAFPGAENISMTYADLFGFNTGDLLLFLVIFSLISCFYAVASTYGSVTIGQLYSKHKVIGSILVYIGIYFFAQIVTYITSFPLIFNSLVSSFELEVDVNGNSFTFISNYIAAYRNMLILAFLISFVIGLACYVASLIIIKKKVNLD